MSAPDSNEAVIFCSRYTHGVDEKRRLQIPAKWRPSDANTELMLIAWDGNGSAGSCLRVYPPQQRQALMQKVATMSTSDPEAVALRRNIAKKSEWVTMDKAGRICIPDGLAAEAGIVGGKEVVLARTTGEGIAGSSDSADALIVCGHGASSSFPRRCRGSR